MKNKWVVLSTGFALFSMFFGSGNLVFPITVGKACEGHTLMAAFGIFLTGVLVPLLGVLGMMFYKGDIHNFFSLFGKKGVFVFSLLCLSLMGPFGVMARCITVAFGAVQLLLPQATLVATSFVMCAVIFLLTVKKRRIVSVLGTILSPLLLISIGVVAYFGIDQAAFSERGASHLGVEAFSNGFFQGYQMMDLLAAFFFSTFVIHHLRHQFPKDEEDGVMRSVFFKSAFVAAFVLTGVYLALVLLGWQYAPLLKDVPPQEMLGQIALHSLGAFAAPCVAVVVVFACLTTAIVLTSLFSEFLRKDIMQEKLHNWQSLVITLAIGFSISTLEFAGIAKFLAPIMEMMYPVLIAITLWNIAKKFLRREPATIEG